MNLIKVPEAIGSTPLINRTHFVKKFALRLSVRRGSELTTNKLHHFRPDLTGALHRRQVAAAGDDFELSLRNKLMHLLALVKRHDVVLGAPYDEHGHL